MKKKRNKLKIIGIIALIALIVILIGSCFSVSYDEEAENLIDSFYMNVQQKNYEANLQYFSDKFYTVSSEEEALKLFSFLENKTGTLETYSLQTYKSTNVIGSNSGKTIIVRYLINRTEGTTKDTFSLFKPMGSNTYRIDTYNSIIDIHLE
jgi:hypothetical protein